MQTYEIKLPIGDWSGDGHGQCEWYTIVSNKPVEQLREIHFKSRDIFDIEDVFRDCDEYGYGGDLPEWAEKFFDEDGYLEEGPDGMCELWVACLKAADPGLEVTILVDTTPMLPFYGFDSKKRHIPHIGYGLFY